MCTFNDFLRWYNNIDVVPTLEAMRKMLGFYHKSGIDMLKLGCTLPNLAIICLHKSTSAKFYPFTETDKEFLQKIREVMIGGTSTVFTRKAVVDETFIRISKNFCKPIAGINVSQLYPCSMCQPMPTGLYTQWEYDPEPNRFKPQQNKSRKIENMVLSYFRRQRPDCKVQSFYTTGTPKMIDCLRQMVFAHIVKLCLRLWAASINTVHVRKHDLLELKKISNAATKREKWTR